ncbi:MAG: acylphosphatase [Dongiaceae bacterium]
MSNQDTEKAVNVRIRGKVQGVWFRAWTMEQATRRNLRGWVRNRSDGSVEALFVGPIDLVDEMVETCWRGPRAAKVDSVRVIAAEPVYRPGFAMLATE